MKGLEMHGSKSLNKIEYDNTITFEVFTNDRKDTVRSREYFKSLWVKV